MHPGRQLFVYLLMVLGSASRHNTRPWGKVAQSPPRIITHPRHQPWAVGNPEDRELKERGEITTTEGRVRGCVPAVAGVPGSDIARKLTKICGHTYPTEHGLSIISKTAVLMSRATYCVIHKQGMRVKKSRVDVQIPKDRGSM